MAVENFKEYSSQCVLDVGARLAEGPHWWVERGLLVWVDIEDSRIGLFDPAKNTNHFVDAGFHVGSVVPMSTGDLLAATADGLKIINPDTGHIKSLHNPEQHLSGNRFNDGKCDPWGRFWFGSLHYEFLPQAGSLWRLDAGFESQKVLEGVTISNGLAWSLDRKFFYHIDTPTLSVRRFLLSDNGDLLDKGEVCVRIPLDWNCVPDGMCIDRNGMLWIALWDGGAVSCWDPRTGRRLASVAVPCSQVTSCCFGGPDFDVLYITTAREGLGLEGLKLTPLAGGIFAAKVDVSGMPASNFREDEAEDID